MPLSTLRHSVRFVAGYQGCSTFNVNGVDYDLQYRAFTNNPYVPDHFNGSVIPSVGTVRRHWGIEEFPPADVVALFPGWIGARWERDSNTIVYDGPAPQTVPSQWGLEAAAPYPQY